MTAAQRRRRIAAKRRALEALDKARQAQEQAGPLVQQIVELVAGKSAFPKALWGSIKP